MGWDDQTEKPQNWPQVSQRQSPEDSPFVARFCGVLLWRRIRQIAFASQATPMHLPNNTFPSSTTLLYSSFTSHLPFLCCLFGPKVSFTCSPFIEPAKENLFIFSRTWSLADLQSCWWLSCAVCPAAELTRSQGENHRPWAAPRFSLTRYLSRVKTWQIYHVWCHLTDSANECKWHKEHVEQMEWDMHVKN